MSRHPCFAVSSAKSAAKVLGLLALVLDLACSSTSESPGAGGTTAAAGAQGVSGSVSAAGSFTTAGGGGSPGGLGGSASGGRSGAPGTPTAGASAAGHGGGGTSGAASAGGGGRSGGSGGTTSGSGGAGGSAGSGTAGAGVAGSSGGGASTGFAPCPETGPCKVLPLGDSITFGLGFAGGYRVELFHLANQDEHEITFTGTQSPNGPNMVDGKPFPRNHAGISGQTIAQIAGRIPTPDLQEVPHIILLHAGTNDMYGQQPSTAINRLESLVDKLIDEAPNALIVVSNIIPFPMSASNVTAFNTPIPALVKEKADAGSHVLFVDQFKDFPTSELGDGVHPNQTGYARMAAKWYAAIEPYLR